MIHKTYKTLFLLISVLLLASCSGKPTGFTKEQLVQVETTKGNIKLKLYNETPAHKDNFIKLVKTNYFRGLLFHRIIEDFMIQGGDPDSQKAKAGQALGNGGPGYTIKAEFNNSLYHKKGALAAAREGDQVNPEKRSSGSQFYIVQGKTFNKEELDEVEHRINNMSKQAIFFGIIKREREKSIASGEEPNMAAIQQLASIETAEKFDSIGDYSIPEDQRQVYMNLGGTPHLDQNYTVFGEVIEGLDIIDSIASVETDGKNRPIEDVRIISMKLVRK